MGSRRTELLDLALSDRKYAFEAYEFLCHALAYTQKFLDKQAETPAELIEDAEGKDETQKVHHVTGQQLLEGVKQYGLEQFGMMTPVVFRLWGVHSTSDFGAMVYRLIEGGHWHKSPSDRLEDFDDLYDFDEAFVRGFKINVDDLDP